MDVSLNPWGPRRGSRAPSPDPLSPGALSPTSTGPFMSPFAPFPHEEKPPVIKKPQIPKNTEIPKSTWNTIDISTPFRAFPQESSSLPFGQSVEYSSIDGPTYLTAQTLVQQVAYALSDKIFSYSPESFDLDVAVKNWAASKVENANGYTTQVSSSQTRPGAGSIALGYMFSKDFDLAKRHVPQSILASSLSLTHMRSALDQLALLYSVANPVVAHIAAVDYAASSSSGLVVDYVTALSVAEELGLGLVCSSSTYEIQHMALLSTLLATFMPTLHIYDGINVGRDTARVVDVLNQSGLKDAHSSISRALAGLSKRASIDSKVSQLMTSFNNELGTSYGLFEYNGHEAPESILVVFGSVESSLARQVALKQAAEGAKVGVINVRLYRPFIEESFLKAIPTTVRLIAVLGQVSDDAAVADLYNHSSLYEDVLAAITFAERWAKPPVVHDVKYARDEFFSPSSLDAILTQLAGKSLDGHSRVHLLDENHVDQYTFWNLEGTSGAAAPSAIGKLLSTDSSINVFLSQTHDNFIQGGTIRTEIRSSRKSIEPYYHIEAADIAVVGEVKLLSEVGILKNLKSGGKILLKLSNASDEDVEKKLPMDVRNDIQFRDIKLFILDPTRCPVIEKNPAIETVFMELAFLQIARPDLLSDGLEKLASINGSDSLIEKAVSELDSVLRFFETPQSWSKEDPHARHLPITIKSTSFTGFEKADPDPPALLRTWESVAKGLAFKEAYGTRPALRPDLTVKSYEITVKENRRLTPSNYDRNIFHIEFDVGNSSLTYNIGEALGIHAENDVEEVVEFMKAYGLNASDVVEVPSRDDPENLEIRTVYQSLLHNIDIFGKPPKKFYEALAAFAKDSNEQKELLTLGSPEGAVEFKRRAEVDTITFADILLEYKSAHPSFHDLARIVSPMKRREYSIASSQAVSPTTVALMIVVVNWVDPKGRDRFGQATRYLSKLPIGAKVTASVKPSVMKLPVKDTAPLIMAGLGTGLAPFRAFVQYRAMQRAQGKEIGAILLYMGSRHQREEYLYGEEWEAYQDAGIITLLGRAFSRDQPQKIYIQDRMRQTIDNIIQAYIKEEGSFYLCGPTWPVPDVTEVLEEAIAKNAKLAGKKVAPRKEIEKLKEDLRYVLEVY